MIGPSDHERLVEATATAYAWHATQTRKGSPAPYVSHLLQVKGLVLEHAGSADQAIAALLHDGLEDAADPGERAERERTIRERFGAAVLTIVLDCTDTLEDEAGDRKRPWRERKERYLDQLAEAPAESLLVAACDKLHNLRSLVGDIECHGPQTLERFNAGPAEQVWFFGRVAMLLADRVPPRLGAEIRGQVDRLAGLIEAAGTDARSG